MSRQYILRLFLLPHFPQAPYTLLKIIGINLDIQNSVNSVYGARLVSRQCKNWEAKLFRDPLYITGNN